MPSDDAAHHDRRSRRVPRVAAALLAAALVLLVALPVLPSPYVAGAARLGSFLLPLPPLLALGAALAALLDRTVGETSKVLWAVFSGLFGIVCVPALFMLVTLMAGP